jgi:hypothetical protein
VSATEIPIDDAPPGDGGWQTDAQGKPYVPAQGRRGIVRPKYEGQSVQEALEQDARDRDERPRRKGAKAKKPPPPKRTDLRELEALLAESFRSPAFLAAAAGDAWMADHFTEQGPLLARNLVLAAEHNPWLRRKLEDMASGGDLMVKVLGMVGLAGALVGYAFPPIVYAFNLPVPNQAREMFGIPPRREPEPPLRAASPPPHSEPQAA